jgi:cytoskeleton-associated protein 5
MKRVGVTKGAKSEPISVQDIAVQTQALLNINDSNKVFLAEVFTKYYLKSSKDVWFNCQSSCMQEDRERLVVRRFKFEDPRIEQTQDLEVDMLFEELGIIMRNSSFLNY